jgi:large subunit ribosomal protein L18
MKSRAKVKNEENYKRYRRHLRVRQRVVGTPEKPRLCVYKSSKHIYAQIIDDTTGRTLATASSLKLGALEVPPPADTKAEAKAEAKESAAEAKQTAKTEAKGKGKGKEKAPEKAPEKKEKKTWTGGRKTAAAREVGRLVAEAAKAKGISVVCFDRGGYVYHGRVAALADAARRNGLQF